MSLGQHCGEKGQIEWRDGRRLPNKGPQIGER